MSLYLCISNLTRFAAHRNSPQIQILVQLILWCFVDKLEKKAYICSETSQVKKSFLLSIGCCSSLFPLCFCTDRIPFCHIKQKYKRSKKLRFTPLQTVKYRNWNMHQSKYPHFLDWAFHSTKFNVGGSKKNIRNLAVCYSWLYNIPNLTNLDESYNWDLFLTKEFK